MASLVAVFLTLLGQAFALPASDSDATAHQADSAGADCILYTVKPGDTCISIAGANGLNYYQMLAWSTACP